MAHKTFISYKYSEAKNLRNRIIEKMGENAIYYNGENGYSPNKSDDSDNAIWEYLKDMIWPTTVTIIILSPNMKESSWIESEISYSLQKTTRDGTQSQRNGVVAVIKKVDDGYGWFKYQKEQEDGHVSNCYHTNKVFEIINNNRFNQDPKVYHCSRCKSYDAMTGSFISFVEEDEFLRDVNGYVEKAFQKAQNDCHGYIIKPYI